VFQGFGNNQNQGGNFNPNNPNNNNPNNNNNNPNGPNQHGNNQNQPNPSQNSSGMLGGAGPIGEVANALVKGAGAGIHGKISSGKGSRNNY